MLITDYIKHCDHILKGLEALQTLDEAGIPNFTVHGLLTFDGTREAFDIVSLRELRGTFKREFQDALKAHEDGTLYLLCDDED